MSKTKLQKYIFILLLVLLPTQLGLHLWPSWSYISGVRVDYLSPTLYITDLLILFLFLLEITNLKFTIYNQFSRHKFTILILGLFVGANVYFSLSPAVSAYKWLKVLEFGFLVYWIIHFKFQISNFKFLLIPVFYESVLAIWQFVAQASIGGFWYWLGERTFNAATPGIANAYINGSLVLRPYGTFPHPNVLGGFLAVVLPLILADFLHNSRRFSARAVVILLTTTLGYVTLFLSMSRAAILVGIVATAVVWKQKLVLVLAAVALLILAPRLVALTVETEPIAARQQLGNIAIEKFAHSPIWGTGLGTSPIFSSRFSVLGLKNYALAFQPPHNIYLLLLAETGLVGLLAFGWIIIRALHQASLLIRNTLYAILVLGLFDHYFLTLQQGQLILALVLGLAFATMKKAKIRKAVS